MALRGTLKDFGLADIFSLVASQNKTGTLLVISREEQVTLFFAGGALVRSLATLRTQPELLGNMLVRAALVTPVQLEAALVRQKNSQKRLGDLLVEMGVLKAGELSVFARLQSTETVYRVFLWRTGTYEFQQLAQAPEPYHPPVRADALLMEGFRQNDEWPSIRRKIASYGTAFHILGSLEAHDRMAATHQQTEDNFDFGDLGDEKPNGPGNIGPAERTVFALVQPQRDVQMLIDLARLGEFEVCRALMHLLDAGLIAQHADRPQGAPSADATVGGIAAQDAHVWFYSAWRVLAAGVGVLFWVWLLGNGLPVLSRSHLQSQQFVATALENELGVASINMLHHGLALYYAVHGTYPDALQALVHDGYVSQQQLHFPWHGAYEYEHSEQGYTLLNPLY